MENIFLLIISFIIAIAIGIALLTLVKLAQAGDKNFKETIAELGGRREASGRYVVKSGERTYWYVYTPPGKNSPPVLTVTMPCVSHGEFMVMTETEFDRKAKRIGISAEVQTDDLAFDERYYITSDTVDFAKAYFQSAEKREGIRKLYGLCYNGVKHNGKTIEAIWTGFNKSSLDAVLIRQTAAILLELSNGIPDYFADAEVFGVPRARFGAIAAYIISSASLVAGVAALIWGIAYPVLDGGVLFSRSLVLSVPAITLYYLIVFLVIRGRSSAHRDLVRIAFLTVIGFVLFGFSGSLVINGARDTGRSSVHSTIVTGTYVTHSKNSTTYHVQVRSWREGQVWEEFTTDSRTYSRLYANRSTAIIVTRPGALGFEWVVSAAFK
ncbi:MAG: hypothetical protein WCG78_03970 [Candidatus Omnitrophota bacterium]